MPTFSQLITLATTIMTINIVNNLNLDFPSGTVSQQLLGAESTPMHVSLIRREINGFSYYAAEMKNLDTGGESDLLLTSQSNYIGIYDVECPDLECATDKVSI